MCQVHERADNVASKERRNNMTLGRIIKYIADNYVYDLQRMEAGKNELICYIKKQADEKDGADASGD